jgi:release factor glutamine methyltransferase
MSGGSAEDTGRDRPWTVGRVLAWTRARFERSGSSSPRLDAEILLAHALGSSRIGLYTQHDRPLEPGERDRFRQLVRRRLEGEPIAYITGEKEFWSRPFRVDGRVLIPRPDTELLVEHILDRIPAQTPCRVVDVGTGSGCVALTLALERPAWTVWATDVSKDALTVARDNADRLGARVQFVHGPLPPPEADPVQVWAANLPYIPSEEVEGLEVGRHEPRIALDGGPDGLDPIRALLAARNRFPSGARLFLEAAPDQHGALRNLLQDQGFTSVQTHRDLAGHPRMTEAAQP